MFCFDGPLVRCCAFRVWVTAHDTSLLKRTAPLQAVNTTPVPTYRRCVHHFYLGLGQLFTWAFVLATTFTPILVADFLSYYSLLVDMQHKQFIIPTSTLPCLSIFTTSAPISSPAQILAEFPQLTGAIHPAATSSYSITHHVITNGPPLWHVRADWPKTVSILYVASSLSSSTKASYIHPRATRRRRSIWCLKKTTAIGALAMIIGLLTIVLSQIAIPYRTCMISLPDLAGTNIYSKKDLTKAYHKIPMEPTDIAKTAINSALGLF